MKLTDTLRRRDFLRLGSFAAVLPFVRANKVVDEQSKRIKEGRRVVTGVNPQGKSVILSDGFVPDAARWSNPKKGSASNLWNERRLPVDLNDTNDPMIGYLMKREPPPGGVNAGIMTWEPGHSYPLHRTATLDFVFVISGKLELILEEGSTIVGPGDTIIQRGTNHGWRVVGNEPCTIAIVLLSAVS